MAVFTVYLYTTKQKLTQRVSARSHFDTGTDLSPPPSPERREDRGGGGFGDPQQRQRTAGGSPAPSAGPEGSASSQTRGLKRLTRKLSFRQRQAQANLQARSFCSLLWTWFLYYDIYIISFVTRVCLIGSTTVG